MKITAIAKKYLKNTYDLVKSPAKYIFGLASKLLKYIYALASGSLKCVRDRAERLLKYIRNFPNRSLKYLRDSANRSLKYALGLVAEGTLSRRILKIAFFPVVLLLLLIIAFFLPDWGNPPPDQSVLYLLSAISQSLAAAFALTFTVTIFCMQISAEYGQKAMSKFFTHDILAYMAFFVTCIIFPLFLMNCPISYLVNLSLLLSAVALSSLIPYFYSFKKQLAIQGIIEELSRDILREVENRFLIGDYDSGIVELDTLYEIIMKTHDKRDFEGFRFGIDKMIKIGIETEKLYRVCGNRAEDGNGSSRTISSSMVFSIRSINKPFVDIQSLINEVVGNYRAIRIIVKRLHENGTASAEGRLEISSKSILTCLDKSLDRIVANRSDLSSSFEIAQDCMYHMQAISAICVRHGFDDSVTFTVYELIEKTLAIMEMNLEEYNRLIIVSVGQVGTTSWSTLVAHKTEITILIIKQLWILGAVFLGRDLSWNFEAVATEIRYFRSFFNDMFVNNINRDNVTSTYAGSYYRSRLFDFFRVTGEVDRSIYSHEDLAHIFEESYEDAVEDYDRVSRYFESMHEYVSTLNAFKQIVR